MKGMTELRKENTELRKENAELRKVNTELTEGITEAAKKYELLQGNIILHLNILLNRCRAKLKASRKLGYS